MPGPPKSARTLRIERLLLTERPAVVQRQLAAEGIHLTAGYLRKLKPSDAVRYNVDASDLIPWEVLPEHQMNYAPMQLRVLARRVQGMPLDERRTHLLDRWLSALEHDDSVIDYDPTAEKPFHPVPRRYRRNEYGVRVPVDTAWIRDPRINDDGSRKNEAGDAGKMGQPQA